MTFSNASSRRHLLTIALEDYFQLGAFNQLIQRGEWYRFEPRLERNTRRVLDLLDETGQQATFFVLGWVAEQMPELIAEVAARGHEIASKGYHHRSVRAMTPNELREDLARAREALQRASGQRILGYRVADQWFRLQDLWALDVLAQEGYDYDSSIGPIGRRLAAEPWRRFAHAHHFADRTLWEFPISAVELGGVMLPIAGGNWFRQLPEFLVERAVAHWDRTYTAPYVMYFHVWELDPELPKISAASWLQRVRTYRHLDRMAGIVTRYLKRYHFSSVAGHLGLATELPAAQRHALAQQAPRSTPVPLSAPATTPSVARREALSLVIPCYNEEPTLPYLANTLSSVAERLRDRYALEYVFVDDCSTDGTWAALQQHFGGRPDCQLIRHAANRGVAGAIGTGLQAARAEIVASIDADCTYDPHTLDAMVPLLGPDIDLVTASPYHPAGSVRNVPEWRLALSRTLSRLYRLVLHHKFYTYTSCYRVYRRSSALQIRVTAPGFLGVAELLARLDLAGGRIVEFPAALQVRVLGTSKMRIVQTITGQLGLLARMMGVRLVGGQEPLVRPPRPSRQTPLPTTPVPLG